MSATPPLTYAECQSIDSVEIHESPAAAAATALGCLAPEWFGWASDDPEDFAGVWVDPSTLVGQERANKCVIEMTQDGWRERRKPEGVGGLT